MAERTKGRGLDLDNSIYQLRRGLLLRFEQKSKLNKKSEKNAQSIAAKSRVLFASHPLTCSGSENKTGLPISSGNPIISISKA